MSHDSQSPIISLDLFIKNPRKAAVQSTTTPNWTLDNKATENTSLHTLSSEPFVPTENHTGSLQLSVAALPATEGSSCRQRWKARERERSGALPGAGSSQRQSRAHIATVRSADWMRAVLNLTPGSACSLTGLPVYLAALSCFLCSS